ncbi:MAG: DNA polymerase III subunit delta' [Thermodesulfovibrionales bacterium]
MLVGAWRRGRLASSYMFAGEQGIGKRFTAFNFAKALNCLDPAGGGDACEACASCRKMNSGSHPDLVAVGPDGDQIRVDEIRKLEGALSYRAYEARVKVAIVDDAEKMNASAANAFLKTLEEPSPDSLIILVTSAPDRLPATIRSRCSRVNFTPLGPDDCLRVISGGKRAGGDPGVLVRLSMGRPGLARGEDLVSERDRFLKTLGGGGKHPWKDRSDMERWLDMALLVLRDMAVLKTAGEEGDLINRDKAGEIGRLCERASPEGIIECYEKIARLRWRLAFNLNRGITWNYAGAVMEGIKGSG